MLFVSEWASGEFEAFTGLEQLIFVEFLGYESALPLLSTARTIGRFDPHG